MRPSEELPIDPYVLAELEAIDATLAGRLVDPEYAELAELTVMVAAERPQITADQARSLDERVIWKHGPAAPDSPRRWSALRAQWAGGLAVVAAAVVAAVVVLQPGGGSNSFNSAGSIAGTAGHSTPLRTFSGGGGSSAAQSSAGKSTGATTTVPATTLNSTAVHRGGNAGARAQKGAASVPFGAATGAPDDSSTTSSAGANLTPAPTPTARKIIRAAQLQLVTPARWINVVAQGVFDVVGQEKGIVRNSQVTAAAGNSGYASFQLSVPTSNLSDTLNRLSVLPHARVSALTDSTQDVNGQYLSDQRRLGDARALRTSLLKQLAAATTQAQISSLQAQIRSAEASINSDESTLHQLQNQISFSQLTVTINGGPYPVPLQLGTKSGGGGGFTLGRAAHDAVNVLRVAAGVALITLAALVPVGLLVAFGAWIALWVRRRRREQALDAA
jgi:hypothetical protein